MDNDIRDHQHYPTGRVPVDDVQPQCGGCCRAGAMEFPLTATWYCKDCDPAPRLAKLEALHLNYEAETRGFKDALEIFSKRFEELKGCLALLGKDLVDTRDARSAIQASANAALLKHRDVLATVRELLQAWDSGNTGGGVSCAVATLRGLV